MARRKTWATSKHPLAEALRSANMAPGALAKESGVSAATISRVLNGRRARFSPEAARRIQGALLGVPLEDLLYRGEK